MIPLAGCGSPDLTQMKPTVWKPTAKVFLVGSPPGWQASKALSLATDNGVAAQVVQVPLGSFASDLKSAMAQQNSGLVLAVVNGPVPQSALSVMQGDPKTNFDVVSFANSIGATTNAANNVKWILPDTLLTSYALGWLAGQFAVQQPLYPVGWLSSGPSAMSKSEMQAALAGIYAGSTGGTPGNSGLTANSTNSVNSSGGSTGIPGFSGTPGTPFLGAPLSIVPVDLSTTPLPPIPKVMVVTRPLTSSEASLLKANGTEIVSLVAQPGGVAAAAQPQLPGPAAVADEFKKWSAHQWSATPSISSSVPFVQVDKPVVPVLTQQALANLQTSIASHRAYAAGAWSQLPPSLQQLWGPLS